LLTVDSGRARVRSNIQSIMIITKARDNRLIKLTKELAIYLMLKRRPHQARGHIVYALLLHYNAGRLSHNHCSYVDSQLKKSRRFDSEGIERDFPELFHPFPHGRTSSNNSLASMSSESLNSRESDIIKEEGQLRYWTSDMCSHSPHLFDFVVTVRLVLVAHRPYNSPVHSLVAMALCYLHPGYFNASCHPFYRLLSDLSASSRISTSVITGV
jgi:hypothetical protein